MHIAIEGMDGSGKTSQAKAVAKKLDCEFIAKSFHEMKDTSGKFDSFVTINHYTNHKIEGVYGLRQNYYLKKIRNEDVVTDRFYLSNYWSRAEMLPFEYIKEISKVWGVPDLIVLLYAEPETLYQRIYCRNPKDKDLIKPQLAKKAYYLMSELAKKMNLSVLIIDTTHLTFDETTEIILFASKRGIRRCKEKYMEPCSIIEPNIEEISFAHGKILMADGELLSLVSSDAEVVLPDNIKYIGEGCFTECHNLKKLTIPYSVTSISDFAFKSSHIQFAKVSEQNERYCSVEGSIYTKDKSIILHYFGCGNDRDIVIPNGTVSLGNMAFSKCRNINSITLPKGLETIQYGVFIDCANLERLLFLDNSIKKIRAGCFVGCRRLRSIELTGNGKYFLENQCLKASNGDIVFYFGEADQYPDYTVPECDYICSFAYTERLKTEKLTVGAKRIGSYAFENCSFSHIYLGEECAKIGEKSFWNCGTQRARITSDKAPEIWNDSFDIEMDFIVEKEKRTVFKSDHNWKNMKIIECLDEKSESVSCGTACLYYICKKMKLSIPKQLLHNFFWIMDLGSFLIRNCNLKADLLYYDSRLMNDYKTNQIPKGESVKSSVDSYINLGGEITEKQVSPEELTALKEKIDWIILNVRSKILFDDDSLEGSSHFVILEKFQEEEVVLISPGKNNIYRLYVDMEKLMQMISENGQWILCAGHRYEKS